MEVKNCKKCRRLFNYISGPSICPQCREELEKKFQEVNAAYESIKKQRGI